MGNARTELDSSRAMMHFTACHFDPSKAQGKLREKSFRCWDLKKDSSHCSE
jgi:hypothetical protein